jgi:ribose/xylose/arabinose/galactoside ABC-type transport system permease subunit
MAIDINVVADPSDSHSGSATAPPEDPRPELRASDSLQRAWTGIAFGLLFVGFSIWLGGRFWDIQSRLLDVHQIAPVLLLAAGLYVTLTASQFDLSVANMAQLTTYLTVGLVTKQHLPFSVVMILVLGAGLIGGLLNGVLVVVLRVNAFIATLGTAGLFVGLSTVYSNGQAITPKDGQLPGWFTGGHSLGAFNAKFPSAVVWFGIALVAVAAFQRLRAIGGDTSRSRVLAAGAVLAGLAVSIELFDLDGWVTSISWSIGVLLIVGAVLWVMTRYTVFGRRLRATGANAVAAELAGVPTRKVTMTAFAISGLLAAAAGMMLAANLGAAQPGTTDSYLLPAFAAAFLSTVLFSSGHFTIWGTIAGGVIIAWVGQGLIVGGLSYTWNDIVNALVLLLAVSASSSVLRRR